MADRGEMDCYQVGMGRSFTAEIAEQLTADGNKDARGSCLRMPVGR